MKTKGKLGSCIVLRFRNYYGNFHIRTVHRDTIKVFYLPTNVQVIALKQY
jgi:hypothetical protein